LSGELLSCRASSELQSERCVVHAPPTWAAGAGGGMPLARGASMTTDKHVDPAAPPPAPPAAVDEAEGDVPEGAVRFELEAAAIEEALVAPSLEARGRVRLGGGLLVRGNGEGQGSLDVRTRAGRWCPLLHDDTRPGPVASFQGAACEYVASLPGGAVEHSVCCR